MQIKKIVKIYCKSIFGVFIGLKTSCQTAAVNVSPWFFDMLVTVVKCLAASLASKIRENKNVGIS